MTKAELIKALEGLPDDTLIYIPSSLWSDDWAVADYVETLSDGSDADPEVMIHD